MDKIKALCFLCFSSQNFFCALLSFHDNDSLFFATKALLRLFNVITTPAGAPDPE
jgi:hypothetical protein